MTLGHNTLNIIHEFIFISSKQDGTEEVLIYENFSEEWRITKVAILHQRYCFRQQFPGIINKQVKDVGTWGIHIVLQYLSMQMLRFYKTKSYSVKLWVTKYLLVLCTNEEMWKTLLKTKGSKLPPLVRLHSDITHLTAAKLMMRLQGHMDVYVTFLPKVHLNSNNGAR